MSHNPNNKDCPRNREIEDLSIYESWACTCPPAADEVEQIRERLDLCESWFLQQTGKQCRTDAITLLRIVDQQRAELATSNGKVEELSALWVSRTDDWEEVTADLAAAQSELAVVDSAPKYEGDSTYSTGWNDCLAWISQNRKALQEPTNDN